MKEEKNDELWQLAKSRADFKTHLLTYVVINGTLWLIWLVTVWSKGWGSTYPWPMWPTLGWGIGLLFNYLAVYKLRNSVEREYEKLKKEGNMT